MLKPSLQLRLGQQLAMTPQLQQAIRLLQLTALDLQQQIRDTLDTNVMLEAEEEADFGLEVPLSEVRTAADGGLESVDGSLDPADGRAIVKGSPEPEFARALYARFGGT